MSWEGDSGALFFFLINSRVHPEPDWSRAWSLRSGCWLRSLALGSVWAIFRASLRIQTKVSNQIPAPNWWREQGGKVPPRNYAFFAFLFMYVNLHSFCEAGVYTPVEAGFPPESTNSCVLLPTFGHYFKFLCDPHSGKYFTPGTFHQKHFSKLEMCFSVAISEWTLQKE